VFSDVKEFLKDKLSSSVFSNAIIAKLEIQGNDKLNLHKSNLLTCSSGDLVIHVIFEFVKTNSMLPLRWKTYSLNC